MSCADCKKGIKREDCLRFTKRKLISERGFSRVKDKEVVRWDKRFFMILGGFCLGIWWSFFETNGKEPFYKGRERAVKDSGHETRYCQPREQILRVSSRQSIIRMGLKKMRLKVVNGKQENCLRSWPSQNIQILQ